ncbi:hypothetical protein TUM12370_05020 [Salmonella enterica subsp. enterica serovar Choleraesuis]|nr:hypothetical protein TUM12370_05020 [Salmonella enterica subsp. enterica serovar Choleraesuis]
MYSLTFAACVEKVAIVVNPMISLENRIISQSGRETCPPYYGASYRKVNDDP